MQPEQRTSGDDDCAISYYFTPGNPLDESLQTEAKPIRKDTRDDNGELIDRLSKPVVLWVEQKPKLIVLGKVTYRI